MYRLLFGSFGTSTRNSVDAMLCAETKSGAHTRFIRGFSFERRIAPAGTVNLLLRIVSPISRAGSCPESKAGMLK